VGPRPCLENEFALYTTDQRSRFAVQPGLTGLWQVRRSSATTFRQMVKMDDTYVTKSSLLLDLQIILQTPLALIEQMKSCARAKVQRQETSEKTEIAFPSFSRN
jgi:lipopolysaccharide/colanic/teichoic acid biosynthesis glycosyltransferase